MTVDVRKATPRPWEIKGPIRDEFSICVVNPESNPNDPETAAANAALIVEAVNNHDRLLRVEKLAGELGNDIKIAAFPPGYEGDPLHFNLQQIDGLLAKVHELQAEIAKGGA